ncbi:MAG: HD domain-containing protein [Oscillospiraceae bacterium]|nr:HD domain-containing protein [Oscillospiraceae bacterium]
MDKLQTRKKRLISPGSIMLFAAGVLLNLLGAQIPGLLGIPIYIDNIGTVFVAATLGIVPGMATAYIGNLFYSFQQPEWLYWGIFGVFFAFIVGRSAEKDKFKSIPDMLRVVLIMTAANGILGELFSWVLSGFDLSTGMTAEYAESVRRFLPLPQPLLRILVNIAIEAADKAVTVVLSYICIRAVLALFPQIKKDIGKQTYSPLRNRMVKLISFSTTVTGAAVFMIACQTYYRYVVANEDLTMALILQQCLTFGGSLFAAMIGAQICLIGFSVAYIAKTVVDPVNRMSKAMTEFVGTDDSKYSDVQAVKDIEITTNDEIENLHSNMSMLADDIVRYIGALNDKMDELTRLQQNIITTMADIIESRDDTTGAHVKRTAAYAEIIAKQLLEDGVYTDEITEEFIDNLRIAAPLHDVGKICVSDAILNKPGRLTDEEFDIMKTHTTHGREILKKALANLGSFDYLTMAEDLTQYHHEWWNGNGYPEQLSGKDIPLSARIMAIADVYDALTSKRQYKEPFPPEKAKYIISVQEKGTHFEPVVVDAFVNAYDKIETARKSELDDQQ